MVQIGALLVAGLFLLLVMLTTPKQPPQDHPLLGEDLDHPEPLTLPQVESYLVQELKGLYTNKPSHLTKVSPLLRQARFWNRSACHTNFWLTDEEDECKE